MANEQKTNCTFIGQQFLKDIINSSKKYKVPRNKWTRCGKTSASGHVKVVGTGSRLLTKTIRKTGQNIWNNSCGDTGHQATKEYSLKDGKQMRWIWRLPGLLPWEFPDDSEENLSEPRGLPELRGWVWGDQHD